MKRLTISAVITGEAVYGTVLVAGLIYAFSNYKTDAWPIFYTTLGTVVVFWIAHVYAEIVANNISGAGHAVGEALHRSVGLLWAMILPLGLLLLGVFGLVPDNLAVNLALWASVLTLTVLGYLAVGERSTRFWARMLGAVATGALGGALILLKAFVH